MSASNLPVRGQGTSYRSTDLHQSTHWNLNVSETLGKFEPPNPTLHELKWSTSSEEETEKYEGSTSTIKTIVVLLIFVFAIIISLCWAGSRQPNGEPETRARRLTGSIPHTAYRITSRINSLRSISRSGMHQNANAGNVPVLEDQWQGNLAHDTSLDNHISQFSHNGTSRPVLVTNLERVPVPGSSSGIDEDPPSYHELYADWSFKGQLPPKYEELNL